MNTAVKAVLILAISAGILYLLKWSLDSFGLRSGMFVFLFNWLLIAWISLVGQFIPISLGAAYSRIRPFETELDEFHSTSMYIFEECA